MKQHIKLFEDFNRIESQQMMEDERDHEVGMAQGQLDYIIKSATELKEKLGRDEKNIPGWIQDHISKAHSYLHQANSGYHELEESKITKTYNFKNASLTKFDEIDASFIRAGIESNPDFNKKTITVSGDKNEIDEIVKFYKGIEEHLDEMTASQVAKKFKVGDTVKFKAGGKLQTDKISKVDGIYLHLEGGGSIPWQSVIDESLLSQGIDEAISVDTIRYERSHGKKPKGRGMWAFYFDRTGGEAIFTPYSMEYADAVKWAKEQAKEAGKGVVYVGESVEENVSEGNAFLAARAKAIEEDQEEFEFNGKLYPVTYK